MYMRMERERSERRDREERARGERRVREEREGCIGFV
jgi:hypothetical protein